MAGRRITRQAFGLASCVLIWVLAQAGAVTAAQPPRITMSVVTIQPPLGPLPNMADRSSATGGAVKCHRLPRSDRDRPDLRDGPLVHVIYLLAADSHDEMLDTRGILDCSVRAQNQWFEKASDGLRWRFDTFRTKVEVGRRFQQITATDVTFVRSELEGNALAGANAVAAELRALGFTDPSKRYLSYVASDGTTCGDAIYPIGFVPGQTVDGQFAQVYIESPEQCRAHEFGIPGAPSFAEAIAQQELIHNDGLTSPGAPHGCLGGVPPGLAHVCTGPLFLTEGGTNLDPERVDIMYPYISVPLAEKVIDRGNDDYFKHPFPHLGDLESSPYLEQAR